MLLKKGLSMQELKQLFSAIFVLLLFVINVSQSYALTAKDNSLWIEFGKQIKERNGSVTQPLFIYYGRFPDKKETPLKLEALRGFYTLNEKDEKGENIFYAVDIERAGEAASIRINALKSNRCTVLVEAKRKFGEITHIYLAKAPFFLFGHCPSKKKEMEPVLSNGITERLKICTIPEHSVWPQTGIPVKFVLSFDKSALSGKKINIADENGSSVEVETGKAGKPVYIPPDDERLNRRGKTAYKQIVILAEETRKSTVYKSSYTLLLHPSRFGKRSFRFGISILAATVAIVFVIVGIRRKNFRL